MPPGQRWRRQAELHAGLCCCWALHGLSTLSLSRPVINAFCFHWDALCLDLTLLFCCLLSILSYLLLCHSASALCIRIKLSRQPVAAGGPAFFNLKAEAKTALDAREQQLKRQAGVLQQAKPYCLHLSITCLLCSSGPG